MLNWLLLAVILTGFMASRFSVSCAQTCTYRLDLSQRKNKINIECQGEMKVKTLEEQLAQKLKGVQEDPANLNGIATILLSDMGTLPCMVSPTIFKDISATTLKLSNLELPFWMAPTSKNKERGFDKLLSLWVSNVTGLQNWKWDQVDLYTGRTLEWLVVEKSRWLRLPSELKDIYGNHIMGIYIMESNVRWLDDRSLECPRCTMIKLKGNDIRELRKEIFGAGILTLRALDISDNKITRLPDDLFQNFDSISEKFWLHLGGNPLEKLTLETFKPLLDNEKLSEITVTGNLPFECDCSISWILDPKFSVNELSCKVTDKNGATSDIPVEKFLKNKCNN